MADQKRRASTPKRRPKNATLSSEKNPVHHHATQPRETRKSSPVFPTLNRAEQTATEASAGHTSPLKPNGEATHQETSLPSRRNSVNSSKATRVLTENIYPLRTKHCTHEEKSSPEESNFRTPQQYPDAQNNDCQKQGQRK